jgi:hypothetical protein
MPSNGFVPQRCVLCRSFMHAQQQLCAPTLCVVQDLSTRSAESAMRTEPMEHS